MNDYYHFDDRARSVIVTRHDTPSPWINYLSNGSLHAFVSQAGGGFCWWKSPTLMRLTRYRAYHAPIDSPGFYVYIREKSGAVWSPTFRPCETELDTWQCTHLPGATVFEATKGAITARLEFYVPLGVDALVWDLTLSTSLSATIELDVFAYVEYSQLDWGAEPHWGYYVKHALSCGFDRELCAVSYLFHTPNHPMIRELPLVYLAGLAPVESWDADRDEFAGDYRSERNPIAVERARCSGSEIDCGEPCGAIHVKLTVPAGGSIRSPFFLGVGAGGVVDVVKGRERIGGDLSLLRSMSFLDAERSRIARWWDDHLRPFQSSLPDADVMRMVNTWNPVQSVVTGRFSRSVSAQAPGIRGVGFRDTCQDMLAIAFRDPTWAREKFEFLLSMQYRDGHAVHTAHPIEGHFPGTTIHSDDHLWLPLLAYALAAETGDLSLFERRIPFLAANHRDADGEATVWEHLMAAVDFTEAHLGAHGIPLTLHSDWNDIIGRFARNGKGESVFAGMQFIYALKLLVTIARARGDRRGEERLLDVKERAETSLAACAWDGAWWRRCYDDDGTIIGTAGAEAGAVWINPQSWAVMAELGSLEQRRAGMDAVAKYLDTDMGIKKLHPAFGTLPEVNDPFTGYSPGCGENAAIFCHANAWAIIAESILGRSDRAWKYYRQLMPHVALNAAGIHRYRGEPYAYASNIVGPDNSRFGWANVTQITGTAPWMEVASTQYLLGVRAELDGLRIDPCIPAEWERYSVSRLFRGCGLEITVENPSHVETGIARLLIDGEENRNDDPGLIPAARVAGRKRATIRAVMGRADRGNS